MSCVASAMGSRRSMSTRATVRELIEALEERFPYMRDARLGRMSVAIDGEVMPHADHEEIGPKTDVHFLSAISGG